MLRCAADFGRGVSLEDDPDMGGVLMPGKRVERFTPEELEQFRLMLEEHHFQAGEQVDDEMRAFVEKHWPWLLEKLPPRKVH